METAEAEKRAAGRAALAEVSSGMTLGLGTGTTVRFFLEALAEALDSGALHDIRGVATSIDTRDRCLGSGIPVVDLPEAVRLDLAVDGADEVSPELDLVKGLGGALLREKIVVQASRRLVVITDSSKEVRLLGERSPVPVEVAPFGWRAHLAFFRSLGAEPIPRETPDGELFRTDNGNHVVDLRFTPSVPDPSGLERALQARAGVVETGLFLGMADKVIVGRDGGVAARERDARERGEG